jgi:hypothetical protein
MSALRIGAAVFVALALAGPPHADAQVAVGGGLGVGVYPLPPPGMAPLYPYAYGEVLYPYSYGAAPYPDPARFIDGLPSCYRFGRCSLRDLERFRDRLHRLERLAPAAPGGAPRAEWERMPRADVAPTPEENIRPEYRGTSLPREEFSASGKPR